MNEYLWFFITLAVALAGGTLLLKLNVPAGAMLGSLVAVGLLNIFSGHALMPATVKILTRTVAGLFVGMSMNMEMVRNIKRLFKPVVMLVVLIQSLCFGVGVVLYHVSDLDVVTSLFSVAPGGMMDMTLMTMDMGGDAAVVAVLQVLRLLSVYGISMPLVKVLAKRMGGAAGADPAVQMEKKKLTADDKKHGILIAGSVAALGGALGWGLSQIFDFSVLILIGAMVASAAMNIKTGKLYMPKNVRRFTQMLSGALIGTSVTMESTHRLAGVILPALLICCGFVVINVILAVVLHKVCKLDFATAMLSSSAGGATEAALTALDFNADPSVVSVLQITRMVCTTSFYPILVQLLYLYV